MEFLELIKKHSFQFLMNKNTLKLEIMNFYTFWQAQVPYENFVRKPKWRGSDGEPCDNINQYQQL